MDQILVNKCNTPISELRLDTYPKEVQEQFFEFISTVPNIQRHIAVDKPYAKDLPKDDKGRIIVDITHPHILEDMDYFRQAGLYFQEHGRYTDLRPNPNPQSDFGKWAREEVRRCYEGYVRPSDGEWITGDYYYFLNYSPIQLTRNQGGRRAQRVLSIPDVFDSHYLSYHLMEQARNNGKHYGELAKRGAGKSYRVASMLAKRFTLGESQDNKKKITCYITAAEKKYLVGDQTLDKFQYDIDFTAQHTQWPTQRLTSSLQNMRWKMGYKDLNTGAEKGTLNQVIGITSKDDEGNLRGTRGVLYVIEEIGVFPRLAGLYNVLRPSVENGHDVFGLIVLIGTAGDKDSDFKSAQELLRNPQGYNIQEVPNIYDKEGFGSKYFTYFLPGYMNLAGSYDKDGNSNVTKALLEILYDRYIVKYNTTDINAITKKIAEIPITPSEAMLRAHGNFFPATQLQERINQLDNNPNSFDDVAVVKLILQSDGSVKAVPCNDEPIRDYPLKTNRVEGGIEIYEYPQKNNEGKVPAGRYILGHDPVDNDVAETASLTSTFVLDLWTDRIVAEYTGRHSFADDNFEICRLLCIFYNGKCLYEQNKKGLYAYFSKMNCLHLLADTPEYLKDKQLTKISSWGNSSKGVNATLGVNNFANGLIRDWLLKPVPKINEETQEEVMLPNLYHIKCRALLRELVQFNPLNNFDRIRSLAMVMLYREEKLITFKGDVKEEQYEDSLANDDFFNKNYH